MGKTKMAVDQAVEYILTRHTEELADLTEQKIAETLELDTESLLSQFEGQQHISLARFIKREKIHRAIFLLEKMPTLSVDGISDRLGFNGLEDFIDNFKSYLAIDPRRYRELKLGELKTGEQNTGNRSKD